MYSPKISEELVRKLYQLKLQTQKPMTNLVNEAVTEYLRRNNDGLRKSNS